MIARPGSGLRSFADLRDRSWAVNEPSSQSGYGITRTHLVRDGETDGFFGGLVEAGSHARAIAMVAAGDVDAAAAALEPAPVFADCEVERLVAVGDSDYHDIRSMLTACRAAGFLELR